MNPSPDVSDHPARILIVDDQRQNRQLLEVMLAPEGFVFQTAATGEEALALVAQQPPDLILLDIMLPGMDGCEVAGRIKGNLATRSIPIIMITAANEQDARMLGLGAGAEDILTRPVDRAELRVRVRNLLRLKAYSDYHEAYSRMLEGELGTRATNLVRSEERMRFALQSANAGVWELDVVSGTAQWSEILEAQYGLRPGTFEGTLGAFVERIHPDDRSFVQAVVEKALRSGGDFSVEHRAIRPDGTVRTMNNIGHVYLEENQARRAVGISIDLTDQRRLEEQFRQSQKMEAVGRLAGGIAHDFNNLLTAIIGYADLLAERVGSSPELAEDVAEIQKAGQRAASLTRQLLTFSRHRPAEREVIKLDSTVAEAEKMLRRLVGEDVLVTTRFENDNLVKVDRGQMEQILVNLAVNARDAMPNGGHLTIETSRVELDEAYASKHPGVKPGPYASLAVSDTGTGMNAATLGHLFEPFFTTKDLGKGTGLGLSTVYGIVKQSGGCIDVYSEPGIGTTFKIYLPAVEDEKAALPAAAEVRGPERGFETILLVEDEGALRILVRRALESRGYAVLAPASTEEALLVCERSTDSIHLLLTDIVMPGMLGPEVARRACALRAGLKVLYMSGYTDESIMQRGLLRGDEAFIQKPFTPEALSRKVREVLDGETRSAGPCGSDASVIDNVTNDPRTLLPK